MSEEKTKKFCELIREAINDEDKAQAMYQELIGSAGWTEYLSVEDTLSREVLISILKEEDSHERLLGVIRSLKCPIKNE